MIVEEIQHTLRSTKPVTCSILLWRTVILMFIMRTYLIGWLVGWLLTYLLTWLVGYLLTWLVSYLLT